ncbi:uncharacterized protein SOCE26_102310 [Sorangium cellulosum]|uniref:Uncharacterized protein n=1 Tax=Sorangium cellulosum TaxID=56 RepID=A0A2L0FAT3_SORCE|nr:hypothetical protein [Sorangium cellulosum]AUX48690.1 uncharacterized protein SOCE26_102310 [Sorangium cellulosum]
MRRTKQAHTGAQEDHTLASFEARSLSRAARERLAGAAPPRGAAAAGEARLGPSPAQRSVTARAARSDMLLVLLGALAAASSLGCGPAGRPGSMAPSGDCPTEYKPLMCLGNDEHCVTDRNGCRVCDCVEPGSPSRPIDRRDVP